MDSRVWLLPDIRPISHIRPSDLGAVAQGSLSLRTILIGIHRLSPLNGIDRTAILQAGNVRALSGSAFHRCALLEGVLGYASVRMGLPRLQRTTR